MKLIFCGLCIQVFLCYAILTSKLPDLFHTHLQYSKLKPKPAETLKLTIATGATGNFYDALKNLVGSVHFYCPPDKCNIAIFCMSLSPDQVSELRILNDAKLYWTDRALTTDANTYAFKPQAISEALIDFEHVLWLDAGSTVSGRIYEAVFPLLKADGYFFTQGQDLDASQWIHDGMLRYYNIEREFLTDKPSYSGNTVGFTRGHFLTPLWVECAVDTACIAPEGHNKGNHRYDQIALTVLVYTHMPEAQAHTELLAASNSQLRGCEQASDMVVWTSRGGERCYTKYFFR